MPAEAQVDAGFACVRLGDGSWPFELDCADASAFVEIDGRVVRVRPLRWREKLSLARFAHLGPVFVEAQMLRIALEDAPVPAREEERAVLCALASWIAAPGDDCVPFETHALAGVTLDVCRAVGLKPTDLDGRDAYEVEALWRVAAGRTPQAPVVASGGEGRASAASQPTPEMWESDLTRIEILPDEQARAEPGRTSAEGQTAAEGPPAAEIDAPAEEVTQAPSMEEPPEPRQRPRELAAVRDFAVLTHEALAGALPEPPEPAAATIEEPVRASSQAVGDYASVPDARMRVPVLEPAVEPSPPVRLAAGWRDDVPGGGARPGDGAAVASATQPLPALVASGGRDAERLFDELADSLERAASALGVDLET